MSVSLYPHQQAALEILRQHPRYGLFMEMGMGKTITVLSLVKEKGWRTLVVCPLSIIEDAWHKDSDTLGLEFVNLRTILRKGTPIPSAQVCAINYDNLIKYQPVLLNQDFDCLALDESTYIKNHKAKRTKAAIVLARYIPNVYVLTGNPAPNSLLELWPQMYCITPECLGKNFYAFRNKYFYPTGYGGYTWKPYDPDRIIAKVKQYAIFMRKEDWLDLPEKTFVNRHITADPEMYRAYEHMRKHRIAELGNDIVISQTKVTQIMRLREITSGFIQDGDKVEWISNAKIKEVEHLLDEIQGQVFIWCNFRAEALKLAEVFKAPVIMGGDKDEYRQELIKEYKEGKHRILIATMGTISHGVTLTNCHHVIYYSLTYSHDLYLQSQDRFHRIGQKNPVTYYHLLVKNSIDDRVLQALRRKEDMRRVCGEILKLTPKEK